MLAAIRRPLATRQLLLRHASTEAYTPPEYRDLNAQTWAKLSEPVREELIEYFAWRMEDRWHTISRDEARAAYFIGYGTWGPRAAKGNPTQQPPAGELVGRAIFSLVLFSALGVAAFNHVTDKRVHAALARLEVSDV
ncbi:AFR240Cp [Eremothecium gossypii ATCC 10895]|uniref:AFR240Cp n=1 Tax=Eremothecium gossypii (strain ATCC 10895 / CBS 109.51 / FGSC 9923 / NRRL Y-1056) TaxID=284811 RepID=Q753T6_EREGS|nr:AFR240Cp [Eremothecium gossypii ATCC 10895]AAS53611.1 AFR240Cp [Eremothecium gossypii ATCC 10895]